MTAAVSLRGVDVTLGRHPALRGIDLHVEEGERVLIVGPSGGGKSTLVRVIAGLVPALRGEITVLGGPPRAGRREVQLLFQDPLATLHPELPVEASLAETLWWHEGATGAAAARRAHEALRAVGLSDVAFRRPSTLSGGERRRASLARVLLARPALLLCDEPTTGLDADLQGDLARRITAAARTVVVVTHDAGPFLPLVDRVVALAGGAIAETLRPADRPATAIGRALLEAP